MIYDILSSALYCVINKNQPCDLGEQPLLAKLVD